MSQISQTFMLIVRLLTKISAKTSYQSRLEAYISSRHPKSTADVEHWERQYFADQQKGLG